jgi:predicted nuclease with TOPRIM domain
MSDLQHVLAELQAQKSATIDLMTKMSDVCGEMRVLVTELRHTQASYESMNSRLSEIDRQVRAIQLEGATNKPILDIANSMYRSQWMTMLAALGAVIGSNWTKLF